MPQIYPDDVGLMWEEAPPTKREKGAKVPAAPINFQLPPAPANWAPPTEFPSLARAKRITVDVESNDKDLTTKGPGWRRGAYIAGVSVGTDDGAFKQYYPVRHEGGGNCDPEKVFGWLAEELGRVEQEKLGANILYDQDGLAEEGVVMRGKIRDVQVAEPLLDERSFQGYSLENIAQKHLGEGKREDVMVQWLHATFGEDVNVKANIWRTPAWAAEAYAIGDVDLPERVYQKQKPLLEKDELWDLFDMECDLNPMLLAMRRQGVPVNLDRAEQLKKEFEGVYEEALARIKHISGVGVDIWASDSIARALDAMGIQYPLTAKTKRPSVNKKYLTNLNHDIARAIMEARRVDKFRGTFLEGYILNGAINGRVYTLFHQLKGDENGTVTGRFSSSLPNLQNIPKRDKKYGPLIRSIFYSETGTWWKFDWSQVEYRIMVHYGLLMNLRGADHAAAAYNSDPNTDFHQMVATLTGLDRGDAKNLNFGLAYNMGLPSLAETLGVDIDEAKRLLGEYHERSPFLKELMNAASSRAVARGYIQTLMKRRRRFDEWEIRNWNKDTRSFDQMMEIEVDGVMVPVTASTKGAQRAFTHAAGNALIQGSAADIMKKAMVMSWKSGIYDVLGIPYLTVHDELDGPHPGGKAADEALAELKHIMETCVSLKVPLIAEGGIGPHWGAIK